MLRYGFGIPPTLPRATTDAQARHVVPARRCAPVRTLLADLRPLLRYGIQPKNAKPGMRPGACKGKGEGKAQSDARKGHAVMESGANWGSRRSSVTLPGRRSS